MEMENSEHSSRWIMPPALLDTAKEFDLFFRTLFPEPLKRKNLPIMIAGPRGVGKTLFTEIFEIRYRKRFPETKKTVRVNIASINVNLIESELFGHIKGAFTGALNNKTGIIELAQNGILILEEIGVIPDWLQAKLLTFIEDGYYRRVGDEKIRHAENVQIIATTNKEIDDECFMKDFLDRFHLFRVPPLHERRQDILYYLHNDFPELVKMLRPYHVLTLLAYNWPGNVREIEKVGYSIAMQFNDPSRKYEVNLLSFKRETGTSMNPFLALLLGIDLHLFGVDVNFLENELNQFKLGLTHETKPPFSEEISCKQLDKEEQEYGVRCCRIEAFDSADEGFSHFYCPLFHQDYFENKNLLDVSKASGYSSPPPTLIKKKHNLLAEQISSFLKKQNESMPPPPSVPLRPIPSPVPIHNASRSVIDISALTEEALRKRYYSVLWEQEHGVIARVEKRAGKKERTLAPFLKKIGIYTPKARKSSHKS
jgi:hypothetical protein